MNHKREWASVLNYLKSVTLYGGAAGQKRAILAADRIVRAAVALSHKAFLYANATLPDGETLVDLDRLHRAVENFEREGEG